MRYWYVIWFALLLVFGVHSGQAAPLQTVDDSELIYYRVDGSPNSTETCTTNPPITLGDFIKKTLPFEWVDGWAGTANGIESLKAGAIAIRTYALSAYHSAGVINVGGQDYRCIKAWPTRINFHNDESITNINNIYPNSVAAVNATDGIYLTHPNATFLLSVNAIDPQFRDETGWFTSEGPYPWTKEIFDPISSGSPQTGMGQYGSKRWAWGRDDSGKEYPKWDYRRILAHYYSEVQFVGISPTPPSDFRSNIVEIQGLDLPNGGLVICKGEVRTGYNVRFQNVGNAIPTDDASFPGLCSGVTNPQTGVGYHVYSGNNLACPNCEGLRVGKLCYPGSSIPPGKDLLSIGFEIFIPDVSQLVEGNTYSLRFDVRRNGVWQGRSNGFPWPPQGIPVTICDTGGGSGGGPQVTVDHPPAIVSYASLNNGRYGFSWSSHNATGYDVQYRSKEIYQASYPTGFNTLFSNTTAQQFSATVGCNEDRLDWQFRVRGRNSSGEGDWVYAQSQTQVYPHPWLSYQSIGALVLDSDPGPWLRPSHILNLGGGSFNWTASDDQTWITTNTFGQGEGTLGTMLYKPGGVGDYFGTITVNLSNFQPNVNCSGVTSYQIPVGIYIREELETYYLPIIFKNGS